MSDINKRISEIGVVPVIKLNNPKRDAEPLAKALCAGDVPVAEVTFRAAGADTAIRLMKEACPDRRVLLPLLSFSGIYQNRRGQCPAL